jgi:subtilisin family serine protease
MWVNEGETLRSREDADGNGYCGDVYGYNFVQNTGVIATDSAYDTGHGTHVAGVIAAENNNGIGISSVAGGTPDNPGVKIMSCQIFAGMYAGSLIDEVRAIKYAADNGAVVLQCSWGYISGAANPYEWGPQFSTDEQWTQSNMLEKKALDYFVHHAGSPDGVVEGGIAVFAAGNEYAPVIMCHFLRPVEGGCELRTRFWFGYSIIGGKPQAGGGFDASVDNWENEIEADITI